MLRFFTALFTLILLCSTASLEVCAQSEGLQLVAGSEQSASQVFAAGMIPPVDNEPSDSFDYLLEGAGAGGTTLIWGDSILTSEHYANVITSTIGLNIPAAVLTSSDSTTTGSTGGLGQLGGEIFQNRMLIGEPTSLVNTTISYSVTGPGASAGNAYVFHGTFSVSADGTGSSLGGAAFGPGVNAVATGGGVMVTWTNVFETPAQNAVFIPDGTGFSANFAIGVVPGNTLTLATSAATSLAPFWNTSAISDAHGQIDGAIDTFSLSELSSVVFFVPPGGNGGGGSGGGGR